MAAPKIEDLPYILSKMTFQLNNVKKSTMYDCFSKKNISYVQRSANFRDRWTVDCRRALLVS